MSASKIIDFREMLQKHFPEAHAVRPRGSTVLTGISCVDAVGLAPGQITEFAGVHASTGSSLLLTALMECTGEALREPVALVDGADAFDPRAVSREALDRLLWVRCQDTTKAMRAVDLLLRDGNMPRVLLDLQLCPERAVRQIPAQAWHRLRLLAERSGTTLCAFTPFQTVPCARTRLQLDRQLPLEAMDILRTELLTGLAGRVVRRGAAWQPQPELLPLPTLAATG